MSKRVSNKKGRQRKNPARSKKKTSPMPTHYLDGRVVGDVEIEK